MSLIEKAMQGALRAPAGLAPAFDAAGPVGAGGAAGAPTPALQPLATLLVLGAGGTLGSAVLAEALVAGRFQRVFALVRQPLASAVRGFVPLPQSLLQPSQPTRTLGVHSAVIVFERERHSNGRDEAFTQPQPEQLLPLARRLQACGVRRLVVLVPHAPALLPRALGGGFASHDEAAVAALGFEHLVFVRAAQDTAAAADGTPRFVRWWLSQLRWMVPQQQQPVRAVTLARVVAILLRLLPGAPPGTRVLAPEALWQAAQALQGRPSAPAGIEQALADWLAQPAAGTAAAPTGAS